MAKQIKTTTYPCCPPFPIRELILGIDSDVEPSIELREDGGNELREDGGLELR